jgi:sugar phosphate isomerase/epimerase
MTNLDFPARAVNEFGIRVLEYVSGFFNNKHKDPAYMADLLKRCKDLGVTNHLIMVDDQNIAALDTAKRKKAVESHHAWVDAAKFLGCSAIRVNLGDPMAMMSGKGEEGTREEVAKAALEGYSELCTYAEKVGINVIVENHFGYSTDPDWLVGIMKQVPNANKGFLPDFGNFCAERSKPAGTDIKSLISTSCLKEHDKYEGVQKMMPYTRGISAKTHKFDEAGNATDTDFFRMFRIIRDSGWTGGYVGIEYEGGFMRDMGGDTSFPTNAEGVLATKKLLERIQAEIR